MTAMRRFSAMPTVHLKSQGPMIALDRPIPMQRRALTVECYHEVPIDSENPRYREPLVDARDHGLAGENYYSRTDGENPPYRQSIAGAIRELWCRQTIVAMLIRVNELLAGHGVELFLWDAYRPIACQQSLWRFFWAQIRREMPHADEAQISDRVRRYVSDPQIFDPANPRTWPVHTTGAAIDLTLRDLRSGALLDMGAGFDEMSPASHTAHFEEILKRGRISNDDIRLRNRRLLYGAMRNQGFTNYSYEFWHFDYGNQMYITALKQLGQNVRAAWYGHVSPPS
jgi:zinc D-Ala-D-Ala dipeptidase